jgi:predicted kinase
MVEDDENSLDATADAFALLHVIAETRLKRRKIVVIDATNARQEDRAQLVRIAKKYHALAVAIVLSPGEDICHERNKARPDRRYGPPVVRNHMASLRRNIRRIDKQGFRYLHELRSSRRSTASRSCASACGPMCGTSMARSTSSATCTAAPIYPFRPLANVRSMRYAAKHKLRHHERRTRPRSPECPLLYSRVDGQARYVGVQSKAADGRSEPKPGIGRETRRAKSGVG